MKGFFREGHHSKDFGFAVLVNTGARKLSRRVLPTSDKYLGDRPHYAHAITAMATTTCAGLEPKVYLGSGNFYSSPTSSIRVYTSAMQRDDDAVSLKPDIFIPEVAVESGVHYDVQDVPYNPAVAVPFTKFPESTDPHSIVQDNNVISLEDAQTSTSVFRIYSDIMGELGVKLLEDNLLDGEIDIKQGYTLWDQLCEKALSDPQLPTDPESLYEWIKHWQDPISVAEVLDISRRFSAKPSATNDAKEHLHLLCLLAISGCVGGKLLDIPRNAGTALMKDGDFDKLFDREETDGTLSRNELQHATHQNTDLAIQISIVGLILQEVAVDVIQDNCSAFLDIMFEIKLLYQQGRTNPPRT